MTFAKQVDSYEINVKGGILPAFVCGTGAPLLFIHGWACDHRLWQEQLTLSDHGYQVITYDRRGFGAATAPADLMQELDDIQAILDFFDLKNIHLIGMSQGGRIALRYTVANPDKVKSLILQGAPIDGFPSLPSANEAIPLDLYRQYLGRDDTKAFIAHWSAHPLVKPDLRRHPLIAEMAADYSGQDLFVSDTPRYKGNIYSQLPDLSVPILYITGVDDTGWLHSISEQITEKNSQATAILVPEAGHFVNLSQASAFNSHIISFVQANQ